MKMIADRTPAKIGRWMKNCEKRMALLPQKAVLEGRGHVGRAGRARERRKVMAHRDARLGYVDAGTHPLHAVDDDDVAGRKAARDDTQAVGEPAGLDRAVLHDALRVDDEHEPPAEIGADRAVVDE